MKKKYFSIALIMALCTWMVSTIIAYKVNGNIFATISSDELMRFGAIDGKSLNSGEPWRILTAQLIHSKQLHMIFNILFGWLVGAALEREIGSFQFLTIYWVGGSIGIFSSVIFYPQYVSSGSSQAIMAIFLGLVILKWRGFNISKTNTVLAVLGLLLQLGLDLYVNHAPKAGHIAGLIAGAVLTYGFSLRITKNCEHTLAQVQS